MGRWFFTSSACALSAAEAAWHGVDLLDVNISVQRGHVLFDDVKGFTEHLEQEGAELVQSTGPLKTKLLGALRASDFKAPFMHLVWEDLNVAASYVVLEVRVVVRPSGYRALSWVSTNILPRSVGLSDLGLATTWAEH